MAYIDNTAHIADGCVIGDSVSVGAFSSIGPEVVLEDNVIIHEHVVIKGRTRIGAHTEVFPFASIGLAPQDLKYHGEPSEVIIGHHCQIRENTTIHLGTEQGGMLTKVGNHCLIMVGAHIAHDCILGDHIIMANQATLAGHVQVDDYAILGGLSAIVQFVRIGKHAMICGMSGVASDIIPYAIAFGHRASLCGINRLGLRRRGFSHPELMEIKAIYDTLFHTEDRFEVRLNNIEKLSTNEKSQEIIRFLATESKRNICQTMRGDACQPPEL